MGYRDRYSPGETMEIVQARTDDFLSGAISEAVFTASIHGLGINRSELSEIIWAAKVKKHQQMERIK